jgi:hypothetical protein
VVPDPTSRCSLTEKLFRSFRCAEILGQRSVVDPVRLRMARVLLYQYCEQLHKYTQMLSQRSRGRGVSSVVIDKILEEMYPQGKHHDPQTLKRRRDLLKKHKKIGKRWCMLIHYIGPGLLLICSSELATLM